MTRAIVDNAEVAVTIPRKPTESVGSIEGRLELINIHGGFEVGIYRRQDGVRVMAKFEEEVEFSEITKLLGKRVQATGVVKWKPDGTPTRIQVKTIAGVDEESTPDITDLFGLDPDITGGLSVEEFLRRQRDES